MHDKDTKVGFEELLREASARRSGLQALLGGGRVAGDEAIVAGLRTPRRLPRGQTTPPVTWTRGSSRSLS